MNTLARLRSTFAELGWTTGLLYLVSVGFRRFLPFLSVEKYYVVAQPVPVRALLPEKRGRNISVMMIESGTY